MIFRCPYCGEKAFSLITKLGITTRVGQSPRCPVCKKTAFRHFVVGGCWLYYFLLGLSSFLFAFLAICWLQIKFYIGVILSVALFGIFFLIFNYYFCYFDKSPLSKKDSDERIIRVQLQQTFHTWPKLRKGEIYELFPIGKREFLNESTTFTIAMIKSIKQDKLTLRVIKCSQNNHLNTEDKLILSANGIQYLVCRI